MRDDLPLIAVFSGPTATILNTPPLITSYREDPYEEQDSEGKFAPLRAQRLAAPVVVYIEAFSAHPLEMDSAELARPADGWLDSEGEFHEQEVNAGKPVYRVKLRPEDGLYLLPYPGRKVDGTAWEDACTRPDAPQEEVRQTFYADARRLYEEIDRFGLDNSGRNNLLSSKARFTFFRAAPSGGYKHGSGPEGTGGAAIGPEIPGRDFYPYYPFHLRYYPSLADLANVTNLMQSVLSEGNYAGAQWLEGSPTAEETLYWFNLLVDTKVPIVGHTAMRPHGAIGSDGERNILSGVNYIVSRVWEDEDGGNGLGVVLIADEVVFAAREVGKTDARPGGYQPIGGHGGIVASLVGGLGPFRAMFKPKALHTYCSELRVTKLPSSVPGVRLEGERVVGCEVGVKSGNGILLAEAMPNVGFTCFGRYSATSESDSGPRQGDVAIDAAVRENLKRFPLAGFVGEGASPAGMLGIEADRALRLAAMSGMPVAKVGRGHPGGEANRTDPLFIAGSNLNSAKARMLLMACLLKLGSLPPAVDPERPTAEEIAAVEEKVARFQALFDSH